MKIVSLVLLSFFFLSAAPVHAGCEAHAAEEAKAAGEDGESACPDCKAGCDGEEGCPDCKEKGCGDGGCEGCSEGCDKADSKE